jgi:hypothetical protein
MPNSAQWWGSNGWLTRVVSLTSGGGYQRRRAEEPVFGGDGDQRAAALSFLSSRKRSLFRNISL